MTDEARMIATAFHERRECRKARTWTDGMSVWLHKQGIAWRDENDIVWVTLAGYPTRTTRDRVNAILRAVGAQFILFQHEGEQFVGFYEAEKSYPITSDEHVPVTDALGMLAHKTFKAAA